jgi:2-polyprenyl-3-methyl-5-hydroxy-6-metoxy-1,4-benzoquinol methylase
MKQWYEKLFENYSKSYDKESFTQGTLGECDFIEKEINFDKSIEILDVGCGTGRHSIELAKRGYSITGFDLSDDQLNRAREKAEAEGVNIDFQKKDARNFQYDKKFDAAIMICEGAFGLMETDEMNFQILKNICKSLSNNGKLIFTTLNGLFPLFGSVKDFLNEHGVHSSENSFDLMTLRDYSTYEIQDDNGNKRIFKCNERYYVPSEITWMLKTLGFSKIDIYGCKLGAFSRSDKLTVEDYEMLVIAEK